MNGEKAKSTTQFNIVKINKSDEAVIIERGGVTNRQFYANDCFICKKSTNLKRCSRCNLISYCCVDHQKEHWPNHKYICNIVSTILKEKEISHIFENEKDADLITWRDARYKMLTDMNLKLGRNMIMEEFGMFLFPRACLVCHDTNQEKLKSCPGCTVVNFCEEHPSNPLHDTICFKLKEVHDYEINIKEKCLKDEMEILRLIIKATPIQNSPKFPSSLTEYLEKYLDPSFEISKEQKVYVSDFLSDPFTVFNAFHKINYSFKSEMIIYLPRISVCLELESMVWEIFLHLDPRLKALKVVTSFSQECLPPFSESNVKLCKKCDSANKKVFIKVAYSFIDYMTKQDGHEKPDICASAIVPLQSNPQKMIDIMEETYVYFYETKCPILIFIKHENEAEALTKSLESLRQLFKVKYDGFSEFYSLRFQRHMPTEGVVSTNQFMSILEVIPNEKKNLLREFFSVSLCQVCRSPKPTVKCVNCQMIFYCGQEHLDLDRSKHEEFCQVIQSLLSETGVSALFDKTPEPDQELWLRKKIDLKLKVELKLQRSLFYHEEEMIYYPKTCLLCHTGDLNILKTCECGISLCQTHQDNFKHQQLCRELSLALKMLTQESLTLKGNVKSLINNAKKNFPLSMEQFVDNCLFLKENSTKERIILTTDILKILVSDYLTRPLTLLYALQKINFEVQQSMLVHVIGAIDREVLEEGYWEICMYSQSRLTNFKIVFIGPEISQLPGLYKRKTLTFTAADPLKDKIQFSSIFQARYEDYVRSNCFEKPDLVIGYNLDIHDSELGILGSTWKNAFLALAKLKVPFVMTSGSAERAKEDQKRLCSILGRPVTYEFYGLNPFASLMPERDSETEGVRYSNHYIIIYKKLNSNVVEQTKVEEESSEEAQDLKIVERERWKVFDFMKYVTKTAVTEIKSSAEVPKLNEMQQTKISTAKTKEKKRDARKISDSETKVPKKCKEKKTASKKQDVEVKRKEIKTDSFKNSKKENGKMNSAVVKNPKRNKDEMKLETDKSEIELAKNIESCSIESFVSETELQDEFESKVNSSSDQELSPGKEISEFRTVSEQNLLDKKERFLKEHLLFEQTELLLKENVLLKERKEQLVNHILHLERESNKIMEENRIYRDGQRQVNGGIRRAMKKKR